MPPPLQDVVAPPRRPPAAARTPPVRVQAEFDAFNALCETFRRWDGKKLVTLYPKYSRCGLMFRMPSYLQDLCPDRLVKYVNLAPARAGEANTTELSIGGRRLLQTGG